MALVKIRNSNTQTKFAFQEQINNEYLQSLFPKPNQEKWRKTDFNSLFNHFSRTDGAYNEYMPWQMITKHDNENFKSWSDWENDQVFSKKLSKLSDLIRYHYGANEPENDFISSYGEYHLDKEKIMILRINGNISSEKIIELKPILKEGMNIFWLILYIERDSKASVFIDHDAIDAHIGYRFIYMEENSKLNLYSAMKDINNSSSLIFDEKIHLEKFASLNQFNLSSSFKNHVYFSDAKIDKATNLKFFSLQYASSGSMNTEINVFHNGDYSNSKILQKSFANEKAHTVFKGNIIIPEGTKKCKGEQQNKNLMMGKNSHAEAIPQLEITTDDVEAAHGSATGELDDEQLYYLQSRGLSLKEAKDLLMISFFDDMINQSLLPVSNETMKDNMRTRLWQTLRVTSGLQIDTLEEDDE